MPIRPENKGRYPQNWKEIVAKVRERSDDCCEWCGARNGEPHPVTGSKVVLTTAHLDHTPENCDLSNLAHLCQRDHLRYDREIHVRNMRRTRSRRREAGQGDLFEEVR